MTQLLAVILLVMSTQLDTTWSDQGRTGTDRVLRVSAGELPVFFEVTYNRSGHPMNMSGLGYEYLQWLSRRMKLRPIITRFYRATNTSNIVSLMTLSSNGTWNGALRDLYDNVSDIAVAIANLRQEHIPYFDFTFPLTESSFFIFGPYPTTASNLQAILSPFSFWTWMLLLSSLFITPLVMTLLAKVPLRRQPGMKVVKVTYGFLLNYFVTVITAQGQRPLLSKLRNCIALAVIWCLASVVLVNAYKGLLTSYLTLIAPKPVVNSYSELVTRPDVQFFTYNNSVPLYAFLEATSGDKNLLGDILRKHPERNLPTVLNCLEQVTKGPYVCFAPEIIGINFAEKQHDLRGECTVTKIGEPVLITTPVFLTRKNYPQSTSIRHDVLAARAFGMEQKWVPEKNRLTRHCDMPKKRSTVGAQKLNLQHLFGPFVLLFIGIIVSCVCFIGEVVIHSKLKRRITG